MNLGLLFSTSVTFLFASALGFGQTLPTTSDYCKAPTVYVSPDDQKAKSGQPAGTADLPSVVQTLEQALKCYQQISHGTDATHPKGLPPLNSVEMDFKTTTGKTVGFSISVFVFKLGASHEKDVTDDVTFTYTVPKPASTRDHNFVRPAPPPLFTELVNSVQAAANAAMAQSSSLGIPLSKVKIVVSYGIKFDGNASFSVPVQLVTIGGNGDYNKNNTQSIALTFANPGAAALSSH